MADTILQLQSALRRLPPGAAFSGLTALWLHGVGLDSGERIEVTVPPAAGVSGRSGLLLRRSTLGPRDVVRIRGLPATRVPRALAEVCCNQSLTEAVVMADAALHQRRVSVDDLRCWVRENRGRHGIRRLRQVIELAEPAAESPMESRLRMVIVLGGLPRPRSQVTIRNSEGAFVGRPDLYYELERLGIEYDGAVHRDSLADDNRRQNRLLREGVRLLRFTARDVVGDPDFVVNQVRGMLHATSAGRSRAHRALAASSAGRSP
jgi:very-short-patch-repair endonuclease